MLLSLTVIEGATMSKPSILLFINQKGGIGKTTTLRETGIYLASMGKKILFADSDPQGNLTKSLVEEGGKGLYDALEHEDIHLTEVRDNLFLLKADKRLSAFADRLASEYDAYTRLKNFLTNEEFNNFDYIFIDIPPGFGVLTINGLAATDDIIIPMAPTMYAMHGANDIMETINKARKQLNPNLNILGVVLICVDERPTIIKQIVDEIHDSFGGAVFETTMSRSVKIEEVIASKIGLIELEEEHKLKDEARLIGQELLERLEVRNG